MSSLGAWLDGGLTGWLDGWMGGWLVGSLCKQLTLSTLQSNKVCCQPAPIATNKNASQVHDKWCYLKCEKWTPATKNREGVEEEYKKGTAELNVTISNMFYKVFFYCYYFLLFILVFFQHCLFETKTKRPLLTLHAFKYKEICFSLFTHFQYLTQ